ncbi:MAG: glycosyltransferase [Lachnospiraceae bacterium]
MMISIVVACLHAQGKLIETLESVQKQSFSDYEVVIKDGLSKDDTIALFEGWIEKQPQDFKEKVKLFEEADTSIYDGMNQAVAHASGEYVYFLNCGDTFYEPESLAKLMDGIRESNASLLFYGNVYDMIRKSVVQSNPNIDAFACYRHVPCHQSCVYHRSLFAERGYYPEYRVRADYDHFLYSFFTRKAKPTYVDVILASYEGGGFSETAENIKKSQKEHAIITSTYMTSAQIKKYKFIMLISLQPIRTRMAESKLFGKVYQLLKKTLYHSRGAA